VTLKLQWEPKCLKQFHDRSLCNLCAIFQVFETIYANFLWGTNQHLSNSQIIILSALKSHAFYRDQASFQAISSVFTQSFRISLEWSFFWYFKSFVLELDIINKQKIIYCDKIMVSELHEGCGSFLCFIFSI